MAGNPGLDLEELSRFLAKVDEVESLVSDLTKSEDSERVLQRADDYLEQLEEKTRDKVVHNRTVINTGDAVNGQINPECSAHFLKSLEEDAKERGERRREREVKGREHKKSGSVSFRGGQHETAVKEFSQALKHMPWDVSLYTNRALAYNQLGRYTEAIADCDAALKLEPHTLKAHLQKAKALTHLRRLVEAEQCYCEAQKQCPDKAEFISRLKRDKRT